MVANRRQTPVIILSAIRSVEDGVRGLQIGSDDDLTSPCALSELLARRQTLIRRRSAIAEATRLGVATLPFALLSREVTRAGVVIDPQPQASVIQSV